VRTIARHLDVPEGFDRIDEFRFAQDMWRYAEVGIARRSKRNIEGEALDVEHDGHAPDEPVLIGSPARRHGRGYIGDGREASVHRG
jgi:hypothetical protein